MAASPTQRTLDLLRKEGYMAEVVEKRIPHTFRARDLFNCIDIVAIKDGCPVLGIQATSRANQSARYKKSVAIPELVTWLSVGCVFEVWGWAKGGPAGKRKLWSVVRTQITLDDIKAHNSQTAKTEKAEEHHDEGD